MTDGADEASGPGRVRTATTASRGQPWYRVELKGFRGAKGATGKTVITGDPARRWKRYGGMQRRDWCH